MSAFAAGLQAGLAVIVGQDKPIASALDADGTPIGRLRLGDIVLVLGDSPVITRWSGPDDAYPIKERLVLASDGTVGFVRQGRLANVSQS